MKRLKKILPIIIVAIIIIGTTNSMAYAETVDTNPEVVEKMQAIKSTEKFLQEEEIRLAKKSEEVEDEKDLKDLRLEYHMLRIRNEALNDDKRALEAMVEQLQREADLLLGVVNQGKADQIPVLLYHHLLPQADIVKHGWVGNDSVLSVESFRSQMGYLKDNGYYTASLKELERYIKGEIHLPKKTVLVSFDDGYLSNMVHAYPIMKELGQQATIFVIGDSELREKAEYDPATTQRMYLPEAGAYKSVFEYGCHTYDYHTIENGKTMLQTVDKESIKADLTKSQELFQATAIAYPFGRYSDTAIEAVQELGYRLGFTVKPGYVKVGTDPYRIPRFVVGPNLSLEQFKTMVNGIGQVE